MSSPATGASRISALLISSDSATIGQLTEGMQKLAIAAEVCDDAATAFTLLNRRKFDAIVVDLSLGEPASQVLERVRLSPSNQTAVTFGITDPHTPSTASPRPNFVIEKPLSAALIGRTLKAAFGLIVREHRRYFRCPVTIPAAIEKSDADEVRCQLMNLSEGGMAVSGASPLRPGAQVKIRFTLPGQPAQLTIESEICWCDGRGRAGLRFLFLSAAQLLALQEWLSARLEESLPESVAQQFRGNIN